MSNAMLWINHTDSTATITGVNVSYTMPLWAFEDMRDIIAAEAEKKVEVTHRDFDIQQELLDRYRAEAEKLREQGARLFDKTLELGTENDRLRELVRDMWDFYCVIPDEPHASKEEIDFSIEVWKRMSELGVEVSE